MSNCILELSWATLPLQVKKDFINMSENYIGASLDGRFDNKFSKKTKDTLEDVLSELKKTRRLRWYPVNADLRYIADSLWYMSRSFGILRDASCLSALNQIALISGEAIAPITEEFLESPKHPNRDHVAHVMAVFSIGCHILKCGTVNGESILNRLISGIRDSETMKWMEEICGTDFDDVTIKATIASSWAVAAFCHDMAYIDEIKSWIESKSCIEPFVECSRNKKSHRKHITEARLNGVINLLAKTNNHLKRSLRKSLCENIRIYKDDEDNELYRFYDHGQVAAALLLDYFTAGRQLNEIRKFWEKSKGNSPRHVALPAIILACFAIFDHDRFGCAQDELHQGNESRADLYWKRNPLGVFLALADLLAEGLRVSWKVFHYPNGKEPDELTDNEREMKLRNFIGIPKMKLDWTKCKPDCLVSYDILWEKYTIKNFETSGEPWNVWKAIYESKTKIRENWKNRREKLKKHDDWNALPEKEKRINELWKKLSSSSGIFLNHEFVK